MKGHNSESMAYDITTQTATGASPMEPIPSGCPLDSRRMEMLHALLPYIPLSMQKFLNIYIGFEELFKAIRIIQNGPLTNPCLNSVKSENPQDLLQILRGLCTPKENEMIDMLFNMNKMMSMYDNYKDVFQMLGGSGGFDISSFTGSHNTEHPSTPPPSANHSSSNPFEMLNQMNQFRNTSEVDDLFQNFMN